MRKCVAKCYLLATNVQELLPHMFQHLHYYRLEKVSKLAKDLKHIYVSISKPTQNLLTQIFTRNSEISALNPLRPQRRLKNWN